MLYPDPTNPLSVDNQQIESRLLDLRPTREIIQEIEDAYTDADQLPASTRHLLSILSVELQDAELRDELELGRPIGCWCLGLGGRQALEYEPSLAVWQVTCRACPEGKEAEMRRDQIFATERRTESFSFDTQEPSCIPTKS